jgi:hypothetical protein
MPFDYLSGNQMLKQDGIRTALSHLKTKLKFELSNCVYWAFENRTIPLPDHSITVVEKIRILNFS